MARRKLAATKEQMQRAEMVRRVAEILNDPDAPSRFAHEGAVRHGLRSAFCLAGAKWEIADVMAASIVSAALVSIGARRPTWQEGQAEWTQDGVIVVERTTCARCAGPMPEDARQGTRYCSKLCRQAVHNHRASVMGHQRTWTQWRAEQTARREHNRLQREVPCEHCGKPFIKDGRHGAAIQRYCSYQCYWAVDKHRLRKRNCGHCGTRFQPRGSRSKYCSRACSDAGRTVYHPIPCEVCGTEFTPSLRTARYCSIQCAGLARVKVRQERQCPICLSIFLAAHRSDTKAYCSYRCSGMAKRREKPSAPPQAETEDPPPMLLAAE
jgi:hypothetical protein